MRTTIAAVALTCAALPATAATLTTDLISGDAAFAAAVDNSQAVFGIRNNNQGFENRVGEDADAPSLRSEQDRVYSDNTQYDFTLSFDDFLSLDVEGGTTLCYPFCDTPTEALDFTGFNGIAIRADDRGADLSITNLVFNGHTLGTDLTSVDNGDVEYLVIGGFDFGTDPFTLSGTFEFFGNSKSQEQPGFIGKLVSVETQVIPLPAAGWMLIAGLGGLAAMRRRTG